MLKVLLSVCLGAQAQIPVSVYEIISQSPDHTVLEQALIEADLTTTLEGDGPFTVFAPTDAAFQAYLTENNLTAQDLLNSPELSDILLHHVVSGNIESGDLTNGEVTTLNGADVTVDLTSGVMIDDASVTVPDLMAGNGVVHVIDDILIPGYDDVTEIVSRSSDHTILLQALTQANLVATLQGDGPFTVFAPTDAAFQAYLTENNITAQDLLNSPELSDILLHHVVAGNIESGDLTNGEVTTLNGADVTVDLSSGVMIDDASVTTPDLLAGNGVVHVINDILIPGYDDVTEIVSRSSDHTILLQALVEANLVATLQGEGSFTVFAPTDAAFQAYLTENNLTAQDLLNSPELSDILLHHVVAGNIESGDLTNGEVTTLNGADVTVDLSSGVMIDDASVTTPDLLAGNGVVHVINDILIPGYDDVTEIVSRSSDHTILLQALVEANLVATLQGEGPFTVFAPTDAAFQAYLTENNITAQDLLNSPELSDILLHHVVAGNIESGDLTNGEVTTLNGADVTVDLTSGVMIDDASVTVPDLMAGNGVVHVIDDILIPGYDDVTEIVSRSSDHTILLQALVEANLVATLQGEGPFTVFAPTDAAFQAYLTENNLTASELLASQDLENILLHHVVSGNVASSQLTNGEVTTLSGSTVTVDLSSGVMIDDASVITPDLMAGNGVVHVIDGILIPTEEDPTAIFSSETIELNIFPNPATSIVNIPSTENGNEYVIYDATGKVVELGVVSGSTINVDALNKGVYHLEIKSNSQVKMTKLLKR